MLLYLIRHGETQLNRERRLAGWTDVPLNENGRELAHVTGKALAETHFDAAFSSPLMRAFETARIILSHNTASSPDLPITIDERLKEINFGTWEALSTGKNDSELPVSHEEYKNFFINPREYHPWEGGETVDDVIKRAGDFLRDISSRPELAEANVLVAMHGLSMRAMLQHVYEDTSDFWHGRVPPNLAVNIVQARSGNYTLLEDDIVYYDESLIPDYYSTLQK
ncbi:MAG: histidine phosphatase family protein [Actinomycetaceae bacterium]|nr:histidine phosphatase family protein [Actinomycetaceae bacterium]